MMQMGKDVVSFLSWAAEPEMEERKLVSFLVSYIPCFKLSFPYVRDCNRNINLDSDYLIFRFSLRKLLPNLNRHSIDWFWM